MIGTTEQRVFGLDVLRATAILCVLFCHAAPFFTDRGPRLEATLLYLGYVGVELFFVLSGYLIAGIVIRTISADQSWNSLRGFWIRRWFRTLPNYFLFFALNILLAYALFHPPQEAWRYLIFAQHALINEAFFSESWSLAVEEWFYILFPLLVWASFRIQGRGSFDAASMKRYFFTVVALFIILTVGLRCYLVMSADPSWDAEVRRTLLYRLDAPAYGVLAAGIHAYYPAWWNKFRAPLSALGMALLFASIAYFFSGGERALNTSYFARTGYFLFTSLSAACILPALSGWHTSSGRSAAIISAISLWSYSLYLCQVPVRMLLLEWMDPGSLLSARAWILTACYLIISIGIAGFCYRYFERPVTDLRERWR